jgi:hypothetical protein
MFPLILHLIHEMKASVNINVSIKLHNEGVWNRTMQYKFWTHDSIGEASKKMFMLQKYITMTWSITFW